MYTFHPIIDRTWDSHFGLYFVVVVSLVIMGFVLACWKEQEVEGTSVVGWFVILAALCSYTYSCSYEPQKVYVNTKVIGEFVQFSPEALVERSGKSTTTKHLMYVTYRVGNELVILPADPGMSYPKSVIMYKH